LDEKSRSSKNAPLILSSKQAIYSFHIFSSMLSLFNAGESESKIVDWLKPWWNTGAD